MNLVDKRKIDRKHVEAFMPIFNDWIVQHTGVESAQKIVHMPQDDPTPLHGIKSFVANTIPPAM